MNQDAFEKQAAVIEMMISMHSILARRYGIFAKTLELLMAVASTVLVALTFADSSTLRILSLDGETGSVLLGTCAILVFLLSIVSLEAC